MDLAIYSETWGSEKAFFTNSFNSMNGLYHCEDHAAMMKFHI